MPEMLVNQTAPDGLPTGRCYTFPLSNVYGPIDDAKKPDLLQELMQIRAPSTSFLM